MAGFPHKQIPKIPTEAPFMHTFSSENPHFQWCNLELGRLLLDSPALALMSRRENASKWAWRGPQSRAATSPFSVA